MKNHKIAVVIAALAWLGAAGPVLAQGTAFTYQGQLNNNGNPVTGSYDLQFGIYSAATNGTLFGLTTNSDTPVTNGLFTVILDFGANVFNGGARWLQVGVRPGGSPTAFTLLQPRQPFTSTPYAITSLSAASVPPGS